MSNLLDKFDEIIEEQGENAIGSVVEIVVALIESETRFKYENAAIDKCYNLKSTTPEKMRDEILAKYFIAGQNLEKIKMIEEGCKLLELTGSII